MLTLLTTDHPVFCYMALALVALVIGSFLNALIYRLPRMLDTRWKTECRMLLSLPEPDAAHGETLNLFWPRSRCPHCKTTIPAWHNIPVLSFLILRGRCHQCHGRIAWRYPIIEILMLMLSLGAAYRFGFGLELLFALFFIGNLLALALIDAEHRILPDCLTLTLLWGGLIANTQALFVPLETAVWSAAGGYLALWILSVLYRLVRKKEGMGGGDIKLFAALGAWFGWMSLQIILLIAALLGAVVGLLWLWIRKADRDTPIPFGPFLSLAGLIALFAGDALLRGYWQLFGLRFYGL